MTFAQLKSLSLVSINSKTIIGPYWLEDGEVRTVIINKENYFKIICTFFTSVSCWQGIVVNQQWFMQDGTTPLTANATLELLTRKFGDRVISQKMDNPWAANSLDLNPCDFFF